MSVFLSLDCFDCSWNCSDIIYRFSPASSSLNCNLCHVFFCVKPFHETAAFQAPRVVVMRSTMKRKQPARDSIVECGQANGIGQVNELLRHACDKDAKT